jgi:copper/silver efflux system protein
MIGRWIDFSASHRFLVLLLVSAAALGGLWSVYHLPVDALPDLGDTQVIVYSKWDRSPDLVEAQVTYPIVSAMLGAPHVKAVRGFSDFGYSYVYAIFDESTDIYWARSRTQEYLTNVLPRLPQGVKTEIGPDATGLGWIFQYALVDESGKHNLAELRSYQDWYLSYYLRSVRGVAEVAPLGGFEPQYQVNVDPLRLKAYGISVSAVVEAVRSGNSETGGRLIEFGGSEYMVRGRGYAKSIHDFEEIAVQGNEGGVPIRIKDLGEVVMGPDIRRGVSDLDGKGEVVSGIVVMRHGENALDVIGRVKAKLKEIEPGLPTGVKVVPVYDRSELIQRSVDNLKRVLLEVIVTVVVVVLIFLWHFPSALIPIITIPVAILIAFIPFRMAGMSANIMSLGGMAIAIGTLVDAAIVVVEQTHKKLEIWNRTGRREDCNSVVLEAIKEVAAPSFFALLVIAISFVPVLTLEAEEGRLFRPLAYTKSLSMIVAAVLTITLDPALRVMLMNLRNFRFRPAWLSRAASAMLVGRIHAEHEHPISRLLIRWYEPVLGWSVRHKRTVMAGALGLVLLTIPTFRGLGSEFMPPLDEGSLLYMPSTLPGISIAEAQHLLQVTDRAIRQFPEVARVMGKAGRAESATDPAPLSMLETVITLKPRNEWRQSPTWYTSWAPEWMKPALRCVKSDRISQEELVRQMNQALQIPGVSNAWTMPVKGRIDMQATGMRTPVGLKISGADLHTIESIGAQIEAVLPPVRATRSVFAERTGGGHFLDIDWNRTELARYGLSIDEAQMAVQNVVGGENVSTTIEGRERHPVNVRYMRDFRGNIEALRRVLVPASGGRVQIPLAELADLKITSGPAMLRNEDGLLTEYLYVDIDGRDPGSYVEEAGRLIRKQVQFQPGYAVSWSGQYEAMERVKQRLWVIVPATLLAIFLLLYLNTKSITKTFIVLLAVPFSAVGAVWFLHLLGYNMSVGVWIGLIALLGVDAETGVFMLLYLDLAYEQAVKAGRMECLDDLRKAIVHGAARRIRPKFMTAATMFIGLVPIMWSAGTGADVMKRIAAPMIGGILTSFLLELVVYPPLYEIWKWDLGLKRRSERRQEMTFPRMPELDSAAMGD